MTRKDYIAMAEAIKLAKWHNCLVNSEHHAAANKVLDTARKDFADMFASIAQRDNPRFDKGRFMAACGL